MPPEPTQRRSQSIGRSRSCPRCDSRSIARSRIRGFVGQAVLRFLNLRPYRCLDCWHRFLGTSTHE